jgi:ribosomal protein S18 acetylase RimI-like enzyme
MNIEISPATAANSAGIAHVQITSYRTAYTRFFPPPYFEQMTEEEQTQDWRDLMGDPAHDPLLVARNDQGEIVGYALGKSEQIGFGTDAGELVALHVLPSYQRNRIGSQLFAAMARELQRRGNTKLILWTIEGNPVRAFYERLGGALVGEKSYDVDDVTVTEVAYSWNNIDELITRLGQTYEQS